MYPANKEYLYEDVTNSALRVSINSKYSWACHIKNEAGKKENYKYIRLAISIKTIYIRLAVGASPIRGAPEVGDQPETGGLVWVPKHVRN